MSAEEAHASDTPVKESLCKILFGLINKEQLAIDNHQDELVKHVGHRQVLVEKFNKLSAELETTGDAAAAGDLTSARRFVPYPVKSHAFSPEFETEKKKSYRSHESSVSVIQMIIDAANEAEKLENRNEVLQYLYASCRVEIEELRTKLAESTAKQEEYEQLISRLTLNLQKVQQQLQSQSTSLTPHTTSDVDDPCSLPSDDGNGDLTSTDPAVLVRKIIDLREKIATCDSKWSSITQELKKEIEDAKLKLEEKVTSRASSAHGQRQPASFSLGEWTLLICQQVEDLKQKVIDLERQVQLKHDVELRSQTATSGDNDASLAFACQIEEYEMEIAEVKGKLSRAESQKMSLENQWRMLCEQLRVAHEKNEREQENNNLLKNLLAQAHCDMDVVESCINVHSSQSPKQDSVKSTTQSPRTQRQSGRQEGQSRPKHEPPKRRGRLEEDGSSTEKGYPSYGTADVILSIAVQEVG